MSALTVRVISSQPTSPWQDWLDVWNYREVLIFLALRDIKVRYKQTILGASWALLQPLLTMLVLSLLFGRVIGLGARTSDAPYALHLLSGLLPWSLFASSVTAAGNSLVLNAPLVTKVYFPRIIIPLGAMGVSILDLLISLALLLAALLFYGTKPTWQALASPVFLVGTFVVAAGLGVSLSALVAEYRDFRHVIPFMLQLWLFVTPVIYPSSLLPAEWRPLLFVNPLTGFVEGFRSCVLGLPLQWGPAAASCIAALLLVAAGATLFRGAERRLADVI